MNLHLLLKNIHILWGLPLRLIPAKFCTFIIEFYLQFLLSYVSDGLFIVLHELFGVGEWKT